MVTQKVHGEKMKEIYILLTKTNTVISRTIGVVTKDPYTHASLSMNRELTELYSFGRIYKNNPLRAGFIQERFTDSIYEENLEANCAIYAIEITDEQYEKLGRDIEQMMLSKENLGYNALGVIGCAVGITPNRKNKYFCSEFVAEMLKNIEVLPDDIKSQQIKPSDFTELEISKLVFQGELKTVM